VSIRTVVVAHREALAAEGIAAGLARYPTLMPTGVATTAAEAERCSLGADAVAIDSRIPGADAAIGRMRKRGLRVVVIGDSTDRHEDDDGFVVDLQAPVAHLAAALVPGAEAVRETTTTALTKREREVLRLASGGLACKQIARSLGISPKTVEQHKTRAFRRLGVPNQVAAVALLIDGSR
jgi:DNA-binding NarL/FixJ family response regulator